MIAYSENKNVYLIAGNGRKIQLPHGSSLNKILANCNEECPFTRPIKLSRSVIAEKRAIKGLKRTACKRLFASCCGSWWPVSRRMAPRVSKMFEEIE